MTTPTCPHRSQKPPRNGRCFCRHAQITAPHRAKSVPVTLAQCETCPFSDSPPAGAVAPTVTASPLPFTADLPLPGGPGSELLRIFAAEWGIASCQLCYELAAQMDEWGPAGCRDNFDSIVADIRPRARDWLHSPTTQTALRQELKHASTIREKFQSRKLEATLVIGPKLPNWALDIATGHYVTRAINSA